MKQTAIQERIEYIVTNGLRYDSRTEFIDGREKEIGWLDRNLVSEKKVKNSPEGLQAHLAELDLIYWAPRVEYMQNLLKTAPRGYTFRFANETEANFNFFQRISHRINATIRLYLLKSQFENLRSLAIDKEILRMIKSKDFSDAPIINRVLSNIVLLEDWRKY
ncbi:MAG: hypothetical protein Q8L29_02210 [archaeon]|nr:hypothetical protein [archaeon]